VLINYLCTHSTCTIMLIHKLSSIVKVSEEKTQITSKPWIVHRQVVDVKIGKNRYDL